MPHCLFCRIIVRLKAADLFCSTEPNFAAVPLVPRILEYKQDGGAMLPGNQPASKILSRRQTQVDISRSLPSTRALKNLASHSSNDMPPSQAAHAGTPPATIADFWLA